MFIFCFFLLIRILENFIPLYQKYTKYLMFMKFLRIKKVIVLSSEIVVIFQGLFSFHSKRNVDFMIRMIGTDLVNSLKMKRIDCLY